MSAQRAYRWLNPGDINPMGIAEFLILDRRLPRSLVFCYAKIVDNLGYLEEDYGLRLDCHDMATPILNRLQESTINSIFDEGLHEFITAFIRDNMALGSQVQQDYRFIG